MGPDLTLEVIYFNVSTDFKMEFEICGCCNMRFLSHLTHSRSEFLADLSKSVIRSRAIIVIGNFNPLDSDYLPKIISKATGFILKAVNKAEYAINSEFEYFVPDKSIPLVGKKGDFGGCVLENNDQTIIMLTSQRNLRQEIVTNLVCPYLKIFADKKTDADSGCEETVANILPPATVAGEQDENQNPEAKNSNDSYIVGGSSEENKITPSPESDNEEAESDNEEAALNQPNEREKVSDFVVLEQAESSGKQKYNLEDFLTEEPESGKSKTKGRTVKAIVSVILVAVVLFSAYFGYEWVYQPMLYNSALNTARELYGQTWSGLPQNMLFKFGKLYQTNRDVIGWLSIPNSDINLPVVSAASRSANYYNNHLFEGSVNKYGTPFTASKITDDSYSRNMVIYGKGDNEISVFSELKNFLKDEYYRSAPVLTFDTLYLENRWKIFSVYVSSDGDNSFEIETNFFDDNAFVQYVDKVKKRSRIETNIDVTSSDELLTLVCNDNSTCVVLVARKVREGETPLVDFEAMAPLPEGEPNGTSSENNSSAVLSDITHEMTESTESKKTEEGVAEEGVADDGNSRYEQQGPVSSAIEIKPTVSHVSSNKFSSAGSVSSVSSGSSDVGGAGGTSSSVSSGTSSVSGNVSNLPTLTVKNSFTGQVEKGPANELIARIIEAEMGSGYHIEALKAQAVAAYSWLLCNGAATGSAPTAPMKIPGARAVEAANAVAGVVATYNGSVAQTFYYAISAGKTANSSDIWSAQLPYLVSVDSSVDKNVNGYQTIRKYSSGDIALWVKESLGIDITSISDKNKWFNCTYDSNNVYVKTVSIGGIQKKGTYLRDTLFTADRVGASNVLRSGAYTISYSEGEDKFIFTVKGYGHGVGMSQTGANAYAKSGYTYDRILSHYYTGISLGMYTV